MNKQEAILRLKAESWEYDDNCFRTAHVIDLDVAQEIISQIHKPQKVKIPQFVADWIEENRCNFKRALLELVKECYELVFDEYIDIHLWLLDKEIDSFTILVNAYQFGYEIEQDKLYRVRILNIGNQSCYITLNKERGLWHISTYHHTSACTNTFTKSELEVAGFGWVFDCDGVKVEEV